MQTSAIPKYHAKIDHSIKCQNDRKGNQKVAKPAIKINKFYYNTTSTATINLCPILESLTLRESIWRIHCISFFACQNSSFTFRPS